MKLFFVALVFASARVLAKDCDYSFSINNATVELLDSTQTVEQSLRVARDKNSPNGRCKLYRVFFSKGLANNYQRKAFSARGGSIDYNLHGSINRAGILKEFADAVTANEYVSGEAPEKSTSYTKSFYISAPGLKSRVMEAGTYSDLVQATIYGYNENSGKYLFEETQNFTAVFRVSNRLQVSLLDEGATFDPSATSKVIDFGALQQNQERGADLRVVSNSPYKLRLSSQNNGNLRQLSGETIAYTVRVNGAIVSLAGSASGPVSIGSGAVTPEAGHLYNLKIRITEMTTHKSAGLYQDAITITATAN